MAWEAQVAAFDLFFKAACFSVKKESSNWKTGDVEVMKVEMFQYYFFPD